MIHLELDGKHSYYTTLAALYTYHTQEELGVTLNYLQNNYGIRDKRYYANRKVIIRLGEVHKKRK